MDLMFKVVLLMCSLGSQARVFIAPRQAGLSLAEPMPSYYFTNIDGHPGTYAFGYDVQDPQTGNTQFRTEERYPNGTVAGSYGYVDVNGRPHRYRYVADERGYRLMTDASHPVILRPIEEVTNKESSVTWSRPKKPNRKYTTNKSFLTKIPINRNRVI